MTNQETTNAVEVPKYKFHIDILERPKNGVKHVARRIYEHLKTLDGDALECEYDSYTHRCTYNGYTVDYKQNRLQITADEPFTLAQLEYLIINNILIRFGYDDIVKNTLIQLMAETNTINDNPDVDNVVILVELESNIIMDITIWSDFQTIMG